METPGGRLREIGLATSKLDDDVKISVVLRESPTKFRDNLLVNSKQFESNKNKLRAIIQAYLKSNKSWIANDFKHDTKESDPMGVDHISKGKKKKQRQRQRQKQRQGDEARQQRHQSATCAEGEGTSRETVGHEQTKTEQLAR